MELFFDGIKIGGIFMDEKDFLEKLKGIKGSEWRELFRIITEMEKDKENWQERESVIKVEIKDVVRKIGSMGVNEPVSLREFVDKAYSMGLIFSFDWPSWKEGRSLINGFEADFEKLDIVRLCKLLTAIIRNDRFCEGELLSEFKRGSLLWIARGIRINVEKNAWADEG